jgi:cell division protease FtsH
MDILHSMAAALKKYETIDKNQIDDLMARRQIRDPEGWDDTPLPSKVRHCFHQFIKS